MRSRIAGLLILSPLALLSGEGAPAAAAPEEIAGWVRDLGSADFEARDAAFRRLLELGAEDPDVILRAIPENDPDPDRRAQCESLRKLVPREPFRRKALAAAGDNADLKQAVEALFGSPSPDAMKALVAGFNAVPPPADCVREALAAFLADDDPELRTQSAMLTGRLRLPGAAARIVPRLTDPMDGPRTAALEALLSLGDVSVVPALETLLKDAQPHVRKASVLALGRLAPRGGKAALRLLECLADPDAGVRGAAASFVLSRAEPSSLAPLAALLSDPKPHARALSARVIGKFPGSDPKILLPLVADPDADVRLAAVEGFQRLRFKPAADSLAKLLADPDPKVRGEAAAALGFLGDPARAVAAAKLLKDPAPEARRGALQALSMLQARAFAKEAAALLTDPDFEVRRAAIGAIGQMDATAYAEEVAKLLGDDKTEVVMCAVAAVANLYDRPEAARRIAPMLQHADMMVKAVATQALGELTGHRWDSNASGSVEAHDWWEAHKDDPEFRKKK